MLLPLCILNRVTVRVVLNVTAVVCSLYLSNPAKSDTISFSVCYENIENIPYYYGEGSAVPQDNPGLYIDILKRVEDELNLNLTLHRAPWARCLRELELNQVDSVLAASYEKSRLEFSHYPMKSGEVDTRRSVLSQSYSLFRHKGSSAVWDGISFSNIDKIGAQIGYSIIDLLKSHNLLVSETASVQRGFSLLQAGRIDGFATIDEIGASIMTRYPNKYDQIEKIDPPITTKPYYLTVSKSYYSIHSQMAEAIWNKIAEIRETELPNLLAKYADLSSSD